MFSEDDLNRIFLGVHPALHRFLTRRVRCPDTASDLLQDIYLRIPQIKPPPTTEGEIRAWLYRVAANLSIDYLRVQTRRAVLLETYYGGEAETDTAPPPEQAAVASQTLRGVQTALAKLPARRADILYLIRVEGLPHAEVAARLGISKSLVEKELVRALDQLRQSVDFQGD